LFFSYFDFDEILFWINAAFDSEVVILPGEISNHQMHPEQNAEPSLAERRRWKGLPRWLFSSETWFSAFEKDFPK